MNHSPKKKPSVEILRRILELSPAIDTEGLKWIHWKQAYAYDVRLHTTLFTQYHRALQIEKNDKSERARLYFQRQHNENNENNS